MRFIGFIFSLALFVNCDIRENSVIFVEVPKICREDSVSMALKVEYTKWIGVKETGNNRGKEVDMFAATRGLKGVAWCNLLKIYVFEAVGVDVKHLNGLAASSYSESRKVAKNHLKSGDSALFSNGTRINHAGFYDERISDNSYYCVEGNFSDAVVKSIRPYNTTLAFCRNY